MNSGLMTSSWGRALGKKMLKGRGKFKPQQESSRWNIVTGDTVKVVQGPQEGQQGTVLQVLRRQNRILVEGVNVRRRAVPPQMDGTPGRMVNRPFGDKSEQLHERHSRADFQTRTQDKLEAASG